MIELLRTYHDIWSSDSVLELRYRFQEKVSFEGIAVQKATLDSLGKMPVKSTEMARSTGAERFGEFVGLSSAAAIA